MTKFEHAKAISQSNGKKKKFSKQQIWLKQEKLYIVFKKMSQESLHCMHSIQRLKPCSEAEELEYNLKDPASVDWE